MIKRLQREMKAASDAMEYERAARLRDDITALQRAMEQNAIVFRDGTDADVIALAEDPLEVAVQIFHVRGGRVRGQRGWVADRFDESGSEELIEQFLLQLYADDRRRPIGTRCRRRSWCPCCPPSPESLTGCSTERRGSAVSIRVPQRGDKRALMETVGRNAERDADQAQDHPGRRSVDPEPCPGGDPGGPGAADAAPLRIECFDISNLQGTEVVASMVVFEDGLPRKSEYRRFVIRQRRRPERRRRHARGDHPAVPAADRRPRRP